MTAAIQPEHWTETYNELPDGNKKLIEFVISRTMSNSPLPPLQDKDDYNSNLRKTLTAFPPSELLKLALKEEKKYTEGRQDKLQKIEAEYQKELSKVPYDAKREESLLAVVDKYKDVYVDFIHGDDTKEKTATVAPEHINSKKKYKEELSKEYNINGFRNRASMAITSDHYRIVSDIKQERPKSSGERQR